MSPWWLGDGDPADAGFGDSASAGQPAPVGETTGSRSAPVRAARGQTSAESAWRGVAYAQRFDRLAAGGQDVHGEADLVARLLPAEGWVLDAGCGTGRVAGRLAELGYRTLGVDVDGGMLAEARRRHPTLDWLECDLAALTPDLLGRRFDLVLAAGNVMPLLAPGTEWAVVAVLAAALRPGGMLLAGFGLDDAHLPDYAVGNARFRSLDDYDAACSAADLRLAQRWSSWDQQTFEGGGYAVSLHRPG